MTDAAPLPGPWEPTGNEATMLSVIQLYGVRHHVTAIQVKCDVNDYQVAVNDPYDRLDDAYAGDSDGVFQTIEIPGFKGRWVLHITPYYE